MIKILKIITLILIGIICLELIGIYYLTHTTRRLTGNINYIKENI